MFTVAEHFHCLPDEVGTRAAGWLLPVYKRVLRSRWNAQMDGVRAVELGTARAITQAFSSKRVNLPELPDFDAMLRANLPPEARMPAWMRRFEEANRPPDEGETT